MHARACDEGRDADALVSDVRVGSGDGGGGRGDEDSNPFAYLRPVLRSEEDDIRKGVFSQALRNLATCALAEKQQWCRAIQDATAGRCAGARARAALASAHVNKSNDKRSEEKSTPTHGACVQDGDEAATTVTASHMLLAQKRERTASACHDGGTGNYASHDEEEGVGHDTRTEKSNTSLYADDAAASEYVAAFMRAQLDRVVGSSLNNLSAHALRVLCLMLRITTTARSKDILYNILASFYYTNCEKLGKRVSRSSYVTSQAHHDAQMLQRLLPRSGAHTSSSSSSSPAAATAAPAAMTATSQRSTRRCSATRGVDAAGDVAAAASEAHTRAAALRVVQQPRQQEQQQQQLLQRPLSSSRHCPSTTTTTVSTATAELEVALPQRIFARPSSRHQREAAAAVAVAGHVAATASSPSTHVTDASIAAAAHDGVSWTSSTLERHVASIVHLYDPVTVTTVVKKLTQVGYHDSDAAVTVEAILRRFHERQQIFYDNGIAYLM